MDGRITLVLDMAGLEVAYVIFRLGAVLTVFVLFILAAACGYMAVDHQYSKDRRWYAALGGVFATCTAWVMCAMLRL